jgi:PAS domain S-box-containing protein
VGLAVAALALGGVGAVGLVTTAVLAGRRRRRRLFALIRRGMEQWETTFDAISDGIALVDGRGAIRRANAALATLAGQPITAVVGQPFGTTLFGEPHALADLLRTAREGARPAPVVHRSATLGRVLRIAAAPVPRATDTASVVCVVEDVTEQQALEAQLIQSEKMAAVGTLASGVAHELNNPLTSIAGLSEFLLEQPGTADGQREHLRVINAQAERAGQIVRDLLTFVRKDPVERSPVDLGEVVHGAVQLMGYELKRGGATADVAVAPSLPPVLGHRHQLQQVVLNLLANALQAMANLPAGRERKVSVEVVAVGDRLELRVTDTGPGLAPEVQAQMFSPFFTTKAPGEGTGLGLYVSYGIAAAHGGTLVARSGPGDGATLVLSLPAATSARPAPADRARGEPAPAGAARRILVVDDDPVARQVVSALFALDGHRVDAAAGGADALRLARAQRYDLVIVDRLASAGGEPLAAALARQPARLAARVVLCTSEARGTGERPRGRPVLHKPFDLRELKKVAEDVFELADESPDGQADAVT